MTAQVTALQHREKLATEIERMLGKYTETPPKADIDHVMVWADVYATAHAADLLVPVGDS